MPLAATLTARMRVRHRGSRSVTRLLSACIAIVGIAIVAVLLVRGGSEDEPAPRPAESPASMVPAAVLPAPAPPAVPEPVVRPMLPTEPSVTPLVDDRRDAPRQRGPRGARPAARKPARAPQPSN
jgi:hypothetical protein